MINQKTYNRLEKYASLVFKIGLNIKQGMNISIRVEAENYEKARVFAKVAYNMGAGFVQIEIKDIELQEHRFRMQSDKQLKFYPEYQETYNNQRVREEWGILDIVCTESVGKRSDENLEKKLIYERAQKRYNYDLDVAMQNNLLPWCMICLPGPVWAKEVLGENGSEDELWDIISSALYLDENEPWAKWEDIAERLEHRSRILNNLKIKRLLYVSSTCDFSIELHRDAVWQGGRKALKKGGFFMPNLPSFENYTTPIFNSTDGFFTTTRPIRIFGQVCEKIDFVFQKGKLVKAFCQTAQSVIDKFLTSDNGSRYVGEVALVDINTPLSSQKYLFSNILYDENATSHIALGSGHIECLKGAGDAKSDKERQALGFNTSIVHTDFMIGGKDMNIDAELYNGQMVKIMQNGRMVKFDNLP